jgi:death-on-curing protein
MAEDKSGGLWYPTVAGVITIHDDILDEYPDTEPGIRNREDIEFALEFVQEGHFGERPQTIHEKAYHLLRLLTANHPFVDGNKRTALDTTATFYFFNGYDFRFDDEVRDILQQFASDVSAVEQTDVVDYLEETTEPIAVEECVQQWREDFIETGVEKLDELREGTDGEER